MVVSCTAKADTPIELTAATTIKIVTPDEASEQLTAAATSLADYLTRTVNVKTAEGEAAADVTIHCGPTAQTQSAMAGLGELAEDEFVITFPDDRTVVIAGGSDYGVEFGVCEFLERYAQVRWLFPGETGEYVPTLKRIVLPRETIRQKPVFLSRTLSGLEGNHYEFCYRNRMGGYRKRADGRFFEFHHNLGALLHPIKYAKTHPEYYPLIHGKRLIPEGFVGWQPCMTNPDVVAQIAANITQHFRSKPHLRYMSLGINDTGGFCQCENCIKANGGTTDPIDGKGSQSPLYYRFVNEVIAKVSETFPDRGYGLLAYEEVVTPPANVELDPRVVPMITRDRMAWIDPDVRAADIARQSRWEDATTNLGWYDYTAGKYWAVPRIYFHQMAKELRYGAEHGVTRYYAEAAPHELLPLEGPKLYLQLKLLWNPQIDVDATLDEWYTLAVGEKAAPALRDYFAHWEDFWTRRVRDTEWFAKRKDYTYLYYEDLGYLAGLSSDDLVICDRFMADVSRFAGPTQAHRDRAAALVAAYQRIRGNAGYQIAYWENNRDLDRWVSDGEPVRKTDFEKGLESWSFWKNNYTFTKQIHSPTAGRNGSAAAGIDAEGERHNDVLTTSMLLGVAPVTPGQAYRITAWYRGEGLPDDAAAALIVRWQDKNARWVEFMGLTSEKPLPLGEQWTQVSIIVTAPQNTEPAISYMRPKLVLKKSRYGKIWFDDVTIEPVKLKP